MRRAALDMGQADIAVAGEGSRPVFERVRVGEAKKNGITKDWRQRDPNCVGIWFTFGAPFAFLARLNWRDWS